VCGLNSVFSFTELNISIRVFAGILAAPERSGSFAFLDAVGCFGVMSILALTVLIDEVVEFDWSDPIRKCLSFGGTSCFDSSNGFALAGNSGVFSLPLSLKSTPRELLNEVWSVCISWCIDESSSGSVPARRGVFGYSSFGAEGSKTWNWTRFFQGDAVFSGKGIASTLGDGNGTGWYCGVCSLILNEIGMRETGEASTTGLSGHALLMFFAGPARWAFHVLSTSEILSRCAALCSGFGDSVAMVSPAYSVVAARGLDPWDLRPAMRSPISKEAPLAALVGVCPVAFNRGRGDLVEGGVAGATLPSFEIAPFVTTFALSGVVAGAELGMTAPCIIMEAWSKVSRDASLTPFACFGGLIIVASCTGVRDRELAGTDFFGTPFFVALDAGTTEASLAAFFGTLSFTGEVWSAFEVVGFSGLLRVDGFCLTGLGPRDVVSFLTLPVFLGLGVLLVGVIPPASNFFGVILLIGNSHEK
jgi:hypothetical protein